MKSGLALGGGFRPLETMLNPKKPMALLAACPAYAPTPLSEAPWAGAQVWMKDESQRMGLGAFKALGGVYAVAALIAERAGIDLTPDVLDDAAFQAEARTATFVCASAGNHGMSVAAGARLFGAACRIHLARTVPSAFEARLRAKGADVVWSGDDYEASVAAAIADAEASGAIHLADGSWLGYTEPPRLVMEGYTVMGLEMRDQFAALGVWPEHVYLQAGVGGLAAAVTHTIRTTWPHQPRIVVVEPEAAPCLRDSAAQDRIATVSGPVSNMGRLDCKTPSLLAFEILTAGADAFHTVSDSAADAATRLAAEHGHASSPSGAAGLAALLAEDTGAPSAIILSEGAVG